MRFPGVLLFIVVLCSSLSSSAVETASVPVAPNSRQTIQREAASPFGIPFPENGDPQAWQVWRQRVHTQAMARRTAGAHPNNASGTASGIIETLAGTAPFQQPVNALKTGFGLIRSITEDSKGNLYIASCDLGVVLKIDFASNTTVFAGRPLATGPATSTGDGGPATSAHLPCPSGLAVDNGDNVYVTDTVATTVREIDASTGIIQTIAGISGQSGYAGDGGPATSALLEFPTGLALDGAGHLFIADENSIRELNLASGVLQTVAGTGSQLAQCWLTASNTCPASQVSFTLLNQTIAFANGHLYAAPSFLSVGSAQSGGNEGSIISIAPSTGVIQLVAGGGYNAGTSSSYPAIGLQFNPQGLAADAAGNLYLTGPNQSPASGPVPNSSPFISSVEELQISDHTMHVVAGIASSAVYAGDGGPATMATLYSPAGICLSPAGSMAFVDYDNIRSFPVGGDIATIAGNGAANFFGDSGRAQQAGLDQPDGVVSDAQGNIYLADSANGRVRRIDAVTGVSTTVAGGGRLYGKAGDGGSALLAALYPTDIALDNSDHLYIRDYLDGLRVVDLETGTISTLLPNIVMSGPMLFDGNHILYIGSSYLAALGTAAVFNDQVWAVDLTTGTTTVIAGDLARQPSGDGGPATMAGLYNVRGLASDGQDHLYLADYGFGDIRQIDLATGIISTIAGDHPNSPNPFVSGYSGDGGPAVSATFDSPSGLAYDGSGHLTVVDSGNQVLRQIDLTTNIITTVVGNHTPGFGGDGGSPAAAMLYDPYSAAYDPAGNLVIGDAQNDRVRRVVLHPTNLKATLTYGGGQSGDSIDYTASYSGLSFGIAPTGSVTFVNGSASLGTSPIAAASDGSGNYVATLTSTSLPAENATITAQYSGDVHYAAEATSITFQQLSPSYTVSANPAALTVSQGSSGSVTFTVTPQNGFNTVVSFSCDATTLPKGVTCSFSPASVTPNGTPVKTTLTVQTTGSIVAGLDTRRTPFSGWLPRGGAALALVLFSIPRVRRKAWMSGTALVLFALCLGGGILGCGGGGSTTGGGTQNASSTPPGSYSIQVTTSAGTVSAAAPVTVALTVTQ